VKTNNGQIKTTATMGRETHAASANCSVAVGTEVIRIDNSIIEVIKIFHLRYVAHCVDVGTDATA
jgi:hypothetical protein